MARTEAPPKQRIADAFSAGRAESRALLMPYLMCAYPDPERFVEIARAAGERGADLLEIGIPFSDPIMDGPVIQEATARVLRTGLRVSQALDLVGRAAAASGRPVLVMTYYNLVFHAGLDRFARACADAGAAGAIVPDFSVEESAPWRDACRAAGIGPVFMAAPTSPTSRLRRIAEAGEGFIYAASALGVTGLREQVSDRARSLVTALREVTDTPIAVGIGVSTPEHAHEVADYADGVIIGSALVRRVGETSDPVREAGAFIASLRAAVSRT